MKRTVAILVAITSSLVSSVSADFSVTDQGTWPKSWPAELEPLRKQARTFANELESLPPPQHYAIAFTKQDEFESAWPHLLKVKSKGGPIVLRRGPSFWLGDKVGRRGLRAHAARGRSPDRATGKMRRETGKRPSTSS